MKFNKLKNTKISEAVASQILKMIENNTLKVGDKLPTESELEVKLGVSRTAIREGMQRLKMINVVEVKPGRGTFISSKAKTNLLNFTNLNLEYNKKTLIEILELRKIIELGNIELIFMRKNDEDLKEIMSCLAHHEKDIGSKFPPEGDISFHMALAKATHNSVLINFFNEYLVTLILEGLVGFSFSKKDYQKSLDLNKKIYDSIVNNDKAAAKKTMEEHFDWLTNMVLVSEKKE
jgi:GntR family transcriptional regulator, transcriptional repressor for pyruvate dehydrogenase complex